MKEILREIKKQSVEYAKIKNQQAPDGEYFFAFSKSQFEEGEKKVRETSQEKLYLGPLGMIGTDKAISEFVNFYDKISKQIKKQCNPLAVFLLRVL